MAQTLTQLFGQNNQIRFPLSFIELIHFIRKSLRLSEVRNDLPITPQMLVHSSTHPSPSLPPGLQRCQLPFLRNLHKSACGLPTLFLCPLSPTRCQGIGFFYLKNFLMFISKSNYLLVMVQRLTCRFIHTPLIETFKSLSVVSAIQFCGVVKFFLCYPLLFLLIFLFFSP